MDWKQTYADAWATAIIDGLATEFPAGMHHLSRDADDCDVTPHVLHPAFWGCLDWHSSAHMQWSGITLLEVARDHLAPGTRDALAATLDARLTPDHVAVEATYLREHPGYERPYGWGWAALLAAAASTSSHPRSDAWATALRPLADVIHENLLAWLPKLVHPVRTGQHDNTAFGLALLWDAAGPLARPDVREAIAQHARRWFEADTAYPVHYEPSGNDFLSAALCEADLMRRVLPAAEFGPWLDAFLPGLADEQDPLLAVPGVVDRTDGKLVHLFGLALSRAWMLRALAPHLHGPDARARSARIASVTPGMVEAVVSEITDGDFMSTHWLVSFALRAELTELDPRP